MPNARTAFSFGALVTIALSAAPAAAQSACDATFQKSGNPITGIKFTATTAVNDLTPTSAVNQLRGIVLARGYDVLVAEADEGKMLLEQPMSGKTRAFPIEVTATQERGVGTVRMQAKTPAGMIVKTDGARAELCAVLALLKGGKAGLAAANGGASATASVAAPVKLNALDFSHQLSKDTQRNPAAIMLRYPGKRFTISGFVDYVIRDGDVLRVAYKILNPWEEAIRLPNVAPFKTDISCLMAKGTSVYALQLKPGKSINLTGTFYRFDEFKHVVWLNECRPAK